MSEPARPRLSVCIPTHDGRAGVLTEALESIVSQLGEDPAEGPVEVCVTDNASRDATAEVIERFRTRLGERLVYRRNATDLGFTGNLLASVAAARGEFVWLLGSDDRIAPGGIAAALDLIERHPGATGFTTARLHFDPEPPYTERPDNVAYLPPRHEEEQVFRSAEAVMRSFGHLQGYISTQILRRSAWDAALAATPEVKIRRARNYPHLELIGRMLLTHPHWVWFPGEIVLHRATAQELEGQTRPGVAAFFSADLADRRAIWRGLHGPDSGAYRALMHAAWRDHGSPQMIAAYKATPDHDLGGDLALLRGFPPVFRELPRFWLLSAPLLLVPHPVMKLAKRVHDRVAAARA